MKQKWIPRIMKEATWLGWSRNFGGCFFSSGSTCVYLSFFYNQLVMWKQTSVSYSTTHIAYPSWFFTRTSQCSIKMKKKKMNTWNKINMDIQKIQMIQWRFLLLYESCEHSFPTLKPMSRGRHTDFTLVQKLIGEEYM